MMQIFLRRFLPLPLALALLAPAVQAGITQTITAEDWARPRHGEWLLRLPALSNTVQTWLRTPDALIRIRYPGGEEGSIWAGELRAWLIAMGIDSDHIELVPGAGRDDQVELSVVGAEGGND